MSLLSKEHVFWSIGFRPFFLLGTLSSLVLIFFWIYLFTTGENPTYYLNTVDWHQHEMLFGFSMSILAGFLLTASQNWTGIPGICGRRLQVLALLFVLGRLSPFLTFLPGVLNSIVELMFLPYFIYLLSPYLLKKGQERNRPFLLLLVLICISDFLFHLNIHDVIDSGLKQVVIRVSVFSIVGFIVVIGTRIIPFFSGRALSQQVPMVSIRLQRFNITLLLLYVFVNAFLPQNTITHVLSLIIAINLSIQFYTWSFRNSFKLPILNILYWGFLFVILGFFMEALNLFVTIPWSSTLHMFTVGGIGLLTYGMISRVSLGHSGRPIIAPKSVVASYFIMMVMTLMRSIGPIVEPLKYQMWIHVSGTLWVMSFSILFIMFLKVWIAPRPDRN